MIEPDGRVVMISGASRGIGRAIVDRLLRAGFTVSAGVRDPRGLEAHERLLVRRYDAESAASAQDWVAATVARFGGLHALVNVAGINTRVELTDPDESKLDR